MKRWIILLLVVMTLVSVMAGCEKNADLNNVGGVDSTKDNTTQKPADKDDSDSEPVVLTEQQMAYLIECGISVEEFYAMDPEQQRTLLAELGIMNEDKPGDEEKPTEPPKEYTTDDVAKGGKFVVRIGDGLWNNYYLYYEDGVLVKVTASFQKNDMEPAEEYVWEGDTLPDFWYYDKTLDELIEYFQDQNYGYTTRVSKMD